MGSDFFRTNHEAAAEYPFVVVEVGGEVVSFAYLSPFHPAATMRRSAQPTYFIRRDHTGHRLEVRPN